MTDGQVVTLEDMIRAGEVSNAVRYVDGLLATEHEDAERYRWLRRHWFDTSACLRGVQRAGDVETVDVEIDAARAKEGERR